MKRVEKEQRRKERRQKEELERDKKAAQPARLQGPPTPLPSVQTTPADAPPNPPPAKRRMGPITDEVTPLPSPLHLLFYSLPFPFSFLSSSF